MHFEKTNVASVDRWTWAVILTSSVIQGCRRNGHMCLNLSYSTNQFFRGRLGHVPDRYLRNQSLAFPINFLCRLSTPFRS
jgi:hypothetical protein